MAAEREPYVLRAFGRHDNDVKWVAPIPANNGSTPAHLLSASRDRTAASWILPSPGAGEHGESALGTGLSFTGHTHFVNFVLYVPSVGCAGGVPMILTGSHDKTILMFNVESSALDGALVGHDDVVKTGTLLPDGSTLVSGGWDNLCIVWDLASGQLQRRVSAHTNNVSSVASFANGTECLSCGGDKTIARWVVGTGEVLQRYTGHTDTVQAVVSLEHSVLFRGDAVGTGGLFASAGNDSDVLVWKSDTPDAPLLRLLGHQSIVYNLAVDPTSGELLSSGDDNTLRVWGPEACIQCIFHPALVWCACALPEGEGIATASADGVLRVWTRDVGNMAAADQVELLESTIAATPLAAKLALRGVDPDKLLPVSEATRSAGEYQGQRVLAKDDATGVIAAYAYGNGTWAKIGVVVAHDGEGVKGTGASTQREKKFHNGQFYDYVFDVEIAQTPCKLPYNRGDSIFDAAQIFIHDNGHLGVSQMDKEQIQNFLIDNIDPEDAALVGAAIPGSSAAAAAGGSGGGAPAFSAFAKELAEMQARGEAGDVRSYRDQYKEMEEEGKDVCFSEFAREEAAAAAGGGGAAQAPSSSSSSDRIVQEMIDDAIGRDTEPFTGFSTVGAAKKLSELGVSNDSAALVTAAVATAAPNAPLDAAVLSTVQGWLSSEGALVAPGTRFPALDVIRALFASVPGDPVLAEAMTQAWVPAAVAAALGGDADTDRMVALRLVSNVAAAAVRGLAVDTATALLMDPAVCSGLLAAYRRSTLPQASAPLKTAGMRSLSCLAALLGAHQGNAGLTAAADAVVRGLQMHLVTEATTVNLLQLVRSLLVLLVGATPAERDGPVRHTAKEVAVAEMFGIIRAKKEYGDPRVVTGCKRIYASLSPIADKAMGA